jgi:hypothetical protein
MPGTIAKGDFGKRAFISGAGDDAHPVFSRCLLQRPTRPVEAPPASHALKVIALYRLFF